MAEEITESSESRKQARLAILELANMISVPMSLNAVVRLNVADAIWEGGSNAPLTASQILARVIPDGSGDAENLQRVLRMLASYGVFEEDIGGGERKYSLTDVGKTLVTDEYGLSYGAYVLQHHQDALMRAWPLVHEAVVDPSKEPFERANGEGAYDYYLKKSEMNELMLKAMSGWVLVTWTDKEIKHIMQNCYKALPAGGKLIACEPVLPEDSDDSHRTRALLEGDIFVMTIYRAKGKHRTEEQFKQLGISAGFNLFKSFHVDYFYTVLEFQK
ncbi:hypothetical protein TSUD_55090 [Trifolium subterraneum]|uniref:Uncharacterized protein n=1 Tax=Trifolium subterraneum TaxID=3900 RepID=A0A2Z6ND91_TRISU|nr:hypothetical protein TSUD_55090 [Trifolium subterraneum]